MKKLLYYLVAVLLYLPFMNNTALAFSLSDAAWALGATDRAFELDKASAEGEPNAAADIADKWFERDYIDRAQFFDKLYVGNDHSKAESVADKWYDRGDIEFALDIDENYASIPDRELGDKWLSRGNNKIALDFFLTHYESRPSYAINKLESFLKAGETVLAEEFANKLLEIWVNQDGYDFRKDFNDKLLLAIRIHSEHYYKRLLEKLDNAPESASKPYIDREDLAFKYSDYFNPVPLSTDSTSISITSFLASKIYIDPKFLEKYKEELDRVREDTDVDLTPSEQYELDVEMIKKVIESHLYDILRQDKTLFSILHAIALYAKKDPYFRIPLFTESSIDSTGVGRYVARWKRMDLSRGFGHKESSKFKYALVHELTHQLMDILYDNDTDPYEDSPYIYVNPSDRVIEYRNAIRATERYLRAEKTEHFIFSSIQEYYEKHERAREYIVRYPQAIAAEIYEPNKKLYQPLKAYWDKYVGPDIDKFINENAEVDDFVSDLERELILHPDYSEKAREFGKEKGWLDSLSEWVNWK